MASATTKTTTKTTAALLEITAEKRTNEYHSHIAHDSMITPNHTGPNRFNHSLRQNGKNVFLEREQQLGQPKNTNNNAADSNTQIGKSSIALFHKGSHIIDQKHNA